MKTKEQILKEYRRNIATMGGNAWKEKWESLPDEEKKRRTDKMQEGRKKQREAARKAEKQEA